MEMKENAINKIIEMLKEGTIQTKKDLEFYKRKVSDEYGLDEMVKNSEILKKLSKEEREKFKEILLKRPVRTISGVAIVAVMTKPTDCPGKCIYCPQGSNAPKSYTGREPATMRAKNLGYDAYKQVKYRLSQLEATGHSTDKVEIIIMGGTFPALPKSEQISFIKDVFDALNGKRSESLEEAHKINEKAKHRCVALTIETRPDFCKKEHIDVMLSLGTTRVELGVQTLDDRVYEWVKRGHSVKDVVEATALLKDSALKVVYHIMPGLVGNAEKELKMFRKMFEDERFMPDMLKIYPVLVIENTELYELWKRNEFKPMGNEEASEFIAKLKKFVPEWCRIMRVQRDIPANMIVDGVTASNLREHALRKAKEMGIRCRCIRCREAGHKFYKEGVKPERAEIVVREYKASGGKEFFISVEDVKKDVLLGFCRLRFPYKPFRLELKDGYVALVRELKVFGTSLPLSVRNNISFQHKGYGRMLMEKAEEIAKQHGYEKIAVISAVGTREYYRKLGYSRDGVYMVKMV